MTPRRRADRARFALLALVAVAGVAGCIGTLDPRARDLPYPKACAEYGLSEGRCEAVVSDGARMAAVDERDVMSVEFIPDPGCGPQPDVGEILCNRSGGVVAYLRLNLRDGSSREQGVYCGVDTMYRLACTDTPEIPVSEPIGAGFSDTPAGATPVPTIDPETAASARPLEVASLVIQIDHVGPYEVEVGRATLPNGILSETHVALRDPSALRVATTPSGLALAVRPTDPAQPAFSNKYERGWHAGTEEVRVLIVFEVTAFQRGASLEIVDLVVR